MPPNRDAPAYLMQPSTTMRSIFEDARFGARLLARMPGFTIAALVRQP